MASRPVKSPYKEGKKFRDWLWYGRHMGVDYLSIGGNKKIYSPVSGVVTKNVGGVCHGADIEDSKRDIHRLCHLNNYLPVGKSVKEGEYLEDMSLKGLTNALHVHWAVIRNGSTIDPEKTLTSDLDELRVSINSLFRAIYHRKPVKEDNDYYLSRIGRTIFTLDKLIDVMKYWAAQPHQNWLKERKKVLGK